LNLQPVALFRLARSVWLAVCLWAATAVLGIAQAQVWGYVDERGVGHFAADKLDQRYELFYLGEHRTPVRHRMPTDAPHSPQLGQSGWETPALMGTAPPDTGAVVTHPKVLAFFDVSPAYKAVRHHIREASQAHGLAPELLQAVIAAESGFDALAVSPKGALGLMQILPSTAQEHGVRGTPAHSTRQQLFDPRTNIHTGARLLARLQVQFPGRLDLVVAAYNAGAGAVRRAGRQVPNIPETRQYVQTVLGLYESLLPPKALQKTRPLL
jgi:Transglycosylase SLT domain